MGGGTVIDIIRPSARALLRRAAADRDGRATGCGADFDLLFRSGYLRPLPGVHQWMITLKGRDYLLRLARAH